MKLRGMPASVAAAISFSTVAALLSRSSPALRAVVAPVKMAAPIIAFTSKVFISSSSERRSSQPPSDMPAVVFVVRSKSGAQVALFTMDHDGRQDDEHDGQQEERPRPIHQSR